MPLLRVSDFCRQFPYNDDENNNNDDEDATIYDDDGNHHRQQHRLPVSVSMMTTSPCFFDDNDDGDERTTTTTTAIVPLSVLTSLSIQDGGLAFLYCCYDDGPSSSSSSSSSFLDDDDDKYDDRQRTTTSRRRRSGRKVAIRLKLMTDDEDDDGIVMNHRSVPLSGTTSNPRPTIVVPPIVITNLGISPHILFDQWDNDDTTIVDPSDLQVMCVAPPSTKTRCNNSNNDDTNVVTLVGPSTSPSSSSSSSLPSFWLQPIRGDGQSSSIVHIAGRVILRPLGRQPQPYYCLSKVFPTTTTTITTTATTTTKSASSTTNSSTTSIPSPPVDSDNNTVNTPSTTTTTSTNYNDNQNDHDLADTSTPTTNIWIYPSLNRVLLQPSMLCAVPVQPTTTTTNTDKMWWRRRDGGRKSCTIEERGEVCYYEVLHIDTAKSTSAAATPGRTESDGPSFERSQPIVYETSSLHTTFELNSDPINPYGVRRLPPLDVQSNCFFGNGSSINERRNNDNIKNHNNNKTSTSSRTRRRRRITIGPKPHPNWKTVAKALIYPAYSVGTTTTNNNNNINNNVDDDAAIGRRMITNMVASTRIVHVIGTDEDHHVRVCVETAARQVGLQCMSIRGLAAFAYDKGHTVAVGRGNSGGIIDQLAGIDAAFHCVTHQRIEPCVLHFYDIDMELSTVDTELRKDQEDRLWCKWIEGIMGQDTNNNYNNTSGTKTTATLSSSSSSQTKNGKRMSNTPSDFEYTPPILVVISTTKPLQPGPWMERLIFTSITLSTPDDTYIRYLWDDSVRLLPSRDGKNRSSSRGTDGVAATPASTNTTEDITSSTLMWRKEYLPLLRGRPAKEILRLRCQMEASLWDNEEERGEQLQEGQAGSGYGSNNIDTSAGIKAKSTTSIQRLEKLCHDWDATRRKASSNVAQISNVRWDDVGGLDHVRKEIMDAIELPLKYPHLFPTGGTNGGGGRSGILLFGPPGTGKTLVAKAVATEVGLPFLSVKGPELLGSYVGESEANVRKVFTSAREAASKNLPIPASILFFDELDSLAPRRGGVDHGGGVMDRVVASLLSELDGGGGGSNNNGRVFVLGATNRPDLLDPSLLRPGRLDRLVYLGIPTDDGDERARILASQLRKLRLEDNDEGRPTDALELAKTVVATLPPRLSGADLSKLVTGATLQAVQRLCQQAEEERTLEALPNNVDDTTKATMKTVTIDQVLERWGPKRCTPTITLHDLLEAARDVTPSVTEAELERYQRLRDDHTTTITKIP